MSDEELVVWEDPPPVQVPRVTRVAELLRANPGRWALIAKTEGGVSILPWWAPLAADDSGFETRMVPLKSDRLFAPRNVYARFRGQHPTAEQEPQS